MAAVKFYIHYEPLDFVLKENWENPAATIEEVIQRFVEGLNKKHQKSFLPLSFSLKKGQVELNEKSTVHEAIKEGDDIFAIEKNITCGNLSCGNLYLESQNNDTACHFHPGPHFFHEGYKGWKCCDRKTIDFDEFLRYETCTVGRHVPKIDKPKPIVTESQIPAPIVSGTGVEVYKNPNAEKTTHSKPVAPVEEPTPPPKEIPDSPDAVIPVGAPCLHRNCTSKFVDDNSRKEECIYHPGTPLFHEGSKGYSCCRKMTLIFEEFLTMEGCTVGVHKFVPDPKPVVSVNVRHDFYQMGNTVIVSFYSKNCDKSASHIKFNPSSMDVELKLSDGQIFQKNIEFTSGKTIDPSGCSFSVLGAKVEVKLRKSSPIDWVKL